MAGVGIFIFIFGILMSLVATLQSFQIDTFLLDSFLIAMGMALWEIAEWRRIKKPKKRLNNLALLSGIFGFISFLLFHYNILEWNLYFASALVLACFCLTIVFGAMFKLKKKRGEDGLGSSLVSAGITLAVISGILNFLDIIYQLARCSTPK